MAEKSILEQALLQVQTLEEAVKQNAKGILASTMKQELNELLKESEMEEEETMAQHDESFVEPKEEEEKDVTSEEEVASEEETSEQEDEDSPEEESPEDESNDVDDENLDNKEPSKDIDSMDSDMDSMNDELPSMDDEMSDDDVLDMTSASDEEVLKVFKAMKPEDGVVVKKDGNKVELETGDDEYIIKLDEEEEVSMEEETTEEWNEEEAPVAEEESMEEENLYEIELDEEEKEETKEEEKVEAKEEKSSKEKNKEAHKEEATEAARTKWNPHGGERAGIKSKKVFKAGSDHGAINEEVENLKKQNAEYKKALVLFKEKLNEVAVFNANLAYATRLFTEHSTTKQEKLNILKRFDSVSTMNESKNLFNTIKTELDTKKPVTESVVEKISNTPTSSSSQEVLAEAKAYENPQFRRMKDLMSKIK